MSDLYERLEEIQGMTRILEGDVEQLSSLLPEQSIQAASDRSTTQSLRTLTRHYFHSRPSSSYLHQQWTRRGRLPYSDRLRTPLFPSLASKGGRAARRDRPESAWFEEA